MIKRLTTAEDISMLFDLKDDSEIQFPCGRHAWMQWLTEQAANPKVGIWATVEQNQAIGYIVAIDNVMPPISDSVSLLYIWYSWKPIKRKDTQNLIRTIEDWGREIGAKQVITVLTESQSIHAKISGFKVSGQIFIKEL